MLIGGQAFADACVFNQMTYSVLAVAQMIRRSFMP
jgi:hypothetical protein